MNEHKGSLMTLLMFLAFIFPALFFFTQDVLERNAFTKHKNELEEMINENGGVNEEVASYINELQAKGYIINLTHNGQPLTTTVDVGERVDMDVTYSYTAGFIPIHMDQQNFVQIEPRNKEGSGSITTRKTKTITLMTRPSQFPSIAERFNIPDLKRVLSIKSNTGSVTLLDQNDETGRITINATDGEPAMTSILDKTIPEQRKYIRNHTSPYYSEGGFEGTFYNPVLACDETRAEDENESVKEVFMGECNDMQTREITLADKVTTPFYDQDGFQGNLDPVDVTVAQYPVTENIEADEAREYASIDSIPSSIQVETDTHIGTLEAVGQPVPVLVSGELYAPESYPLTMKFETLQEYSDQYWLNNTAATKTLRDANPSIQVPTSIANDPLMYNQPKIALAREGVPNPETGYIAQLSYQYQDLLASGYALAPDLSSLTGLPYADTGTRDEHVYERYNKSWMAYSLDKPPTSYKDHRDYIRTNSNHIITRSLNYAYEHTQPDIKEHNDQYTTMPLRLYDVKRDQIPYYAQITSNEYQSRLWQKSYFLNDETKYINTTFPEIMPILFNQNPILAQHGFREHIEIGSPSEIASLPPINTPNNRPYVIEVKRSQNPRLLKTEIARDLAPFNLTNQSDTAQIWTDLETMTRDDVNLKYSKTHSQNEFFKTSLSRKYDNPKVTHVIFQDINYTKSNGEEFYEYGETDTCYLEEDDPDYYRICIDYRHYRGVYVIFEKDVDYYEETYKGELLYPEHDTRVYKYVQQYKGELTPKVDPLDNPNTKLQYYTGTVYSTNNDSRDYNWSGWVTRPAQVRNETVHSYAYSITIEYETD